VYSRILEEGVGSDAGVGETRDKGLEGPDNDMAEDFCSLGMWPRSVDRGKFLALSEKKGTLGGGKNEEAEGDKAKNRI